MSNQKPTYEELEKKLAESEALMEALRKHEIDAIIGEENVAVVRLREVEEQLVEARKIAEQRANDLEAFSYSVSHDLRTPLRVIKAFSNIILEDYAPRLDDTGRGYLKLIAGGVDKMTKLIDDMLELSRVSRHQLHKEEVDLHRFVATIISEIRASEPQRDAEVIIGENIVLNADQKLLTIAFTNLLGNAWKFTSRTPHPRIEIGSIRQDNKTVIFVRDNGAGFDMSHVNRLFRAFQRLHSESEFPGTGVGLAIVKRVIEKHGGSVWAESEPGKGATFYFTIP